MTTLAERDRILQGLLLDPKVQQAMAERCEQQGHDWQGGADFHPVHVLVVYQVCQWCGARK